MGGTVGNAVLRRSLVETDQEGRSIGKFVFAKKILGTLAIVVQYTYSHPPVSGRTGKLQDLRRLIAALETAGKIGRAPFIDERSNLDAPAATGIEGGGGLEHFKPNHGGAGEIDIERFGGSKRQVEDATFDKRAAISDTQQSGAAGLDVGDTHDGAKRQREVGRGHGVHVVDLAIRAAAIVIWRSVPTGGAGLLEDGLGIGRDGNFRLSGRRGRRRSLGGRLRRRRRRWWNRDLGALVSATDKKSRAQKEREQRRAKTGPAMIHEFLRCDSR